MIRKVSAGLVSVALVGCAAVGEDYEPPTSTEAGEMGAWNGRLEGAVSDADLDPEVLAEWWLVLDDPLLTSLVERAKDANLDLRTAAVQLRKARAQRQIAAAAGAPQVGASAGATRQNVGGSTSSLYSAGLDASWEVDVFGRIERGVEAAEADLDAARESRRDVLVTVLAEVALNYIDLVTAQRRLRVAEDDLAGQEESLDIARLKVELGAAAPSELDQAITNVESTRASLHTFDQQIHEIENRLALLIGENPGALDDELGDVSSLNLPPVQVAVGVPAEVLRRRPDVRASERQLAAETARVGVATADLYPVFSLGGSIGLQSPSTGNLFDTASRTFGLGPRIQWNAFDGGRVRQQIEIQSATQEEALVQYERVILTALEDVDNAISFFTKQQLRQRSLTTALASASEVAESARKRYVAGETDFLPVLDAERTLRRTSDDLAVTEGDVLAGLVLLYKALGGGWDSEAATP